MNTIRSCPRRLIASILGIVLGATSGSAADVRTVGDALAVAAQASTPEELQQAVLGLDVFSMSEIVESLHTIPADKRGPVLSAIAVSFTLAATSPAMNRQVTLNLQKALHDRGRRSNALWLIDTLETRGGIVVDAALRHAVEATSRDMSASIEDRIRAITLLTRFTVDDESPSSTLCTESGTALDGLPEDPEVQRARVKQLVELRCPGTSERLLRIVTNPPEAGGLTLLRASIKGLGDLADSTTAKALVPHLGSTDEYIHATAAIALGRLGGTDAVRGLLDNETRFDGAYVGAAVPLLAPGIFAVLDDPRDTDAVMLAIRASQYLYEPDQITRIKERSLSLAQSDKRPEIVRLALGRLFGMLDRAEAQGLVDEVAEEFRGTSEYKTMALYASSSPAEGVLATTQARVLTPADDSHRLVAAPPPVRVTGNRSTHEYGDPGYRDNDLPGSGLVGWLGHTGLMAGLDSSHMSRIIEVNGTSYVVKHNYWSGMFNHSNYWGANTLNNGQYYMTFTRRKSVMTTATQLIGMDIGYPVLPTPDLLRHVSNPGTYVSTSEITHLRCDGLVEYAYEWNNLDVWGRNGANYDVSVAANVPSHNDFYDYPYNPDTETAPVVQCGQAGGSSTRMTWAAQTDTPTYEASYTASGMSITVTVKATDRSGIHHIARRVSGSWAYSPTQPQHPTSDNYSWQFTFTAGAGMWVDYFAVDGAGNTGATYSIWVMPQPNAPTNLRATAASGNRIDLAWTDNSGVESGFKIERKIGAGGSWSQITTRSSNVTTYPDTSVACGTQYYYRVRAYNESGNSAYTNEANATTTTCSYTLTVQVNGTGSVSSSPSGINGCTNSCSSPFDAGQVVTLSHSAGSGWVFQSWSGDCSGSGSCQVTMSAARSVTATFQQQVTTVRVIASDASARESGQDTGTFMVERQGSTTAALTVNYAVGGTANLGSDYTMPTGSVTIQASQSSASISVSPIDDSIAESPETVVLTLSSGSYTLGSPQSASITIADNDAVITVTATDAAAAEAGSNSGTVRISRSVTSLEPLTVQYSLAGTATNGVDYSSLATSAVIPSNATSTDVVVNPTLDQIADPDETVILSLSAGSDYVVGNPSSATITIADAFGPPANVVATAISSTTVYVTWSPGLGAASYRVYRRTGTLGGFTLAGTADGTTFTDSGVVANSAYLYTVRSFSGTESANSNLDLASTFVFDNPTIEPRVTRIHAIHFTQLLSAINGVRALAGLTPIAFSGSPPAPGGILRAQHLLDLRQGLDGARSTLGLGAMVYTYPSIVPTATPARGADVVDLREGIR